MTYKHVTRAIIYNNDGHVFLAKRAGGRGANQWALIGGKPEGSETPIETIVREVEEEAGLVFEPRLFKEEIDTSDPEQHWKVSYFAGEATGDLNLDDDNLAAEYFSPEQLAALDIAFGHLRIIQEFLNAPAR